MTVSLSFIGGAGWQFFDNNGNPLSGGKLYSYAAGTTTPLATYTSRDGLTPNTNPIILDAAGRTPQQVWSTESLLYKYVIQTANNDLIRVWDNIGGVLVAGDFSADLASTTDNAKGDALVGFKQSNTSGFLTGATARTVNGKLQEFVSVKDFGATGNGVTDDKAAIIAALNASDSVYFPAGTYRVIGSAYYYLTRDKFLYGDGNATIYFATSGDNWTFDSAVKRTTQLSADLAEGQAYMDVVNATDVNVGDIIHLDTATPVDATFGYQKQCVRRVSTVSGTRIGLDQPLDFFFTVAESTRVDFANPYGVQADGVNILCGVASSPSGDNYMRLVRTCNSAWRNATLSGSVNGWVTGWSDVFYTVVCDRTLFDNIKFMMSRYSPQITQGTRFTIVSNFTADRIRHMDCNTWAQDTLFVNGTGIATDGIIQTHPSIRNTFRNINDSIDQSLLYGIDLRCAGSIVEDCSASRIDGEIGANTNGFLPRPEYRTWARKYNRRITRFSSTTAVLQNRDTIGSIEINDCNVPDIGMFDGSYIGDIKIGNNNTLTSPDYSMQYNQLTRWLADNGITPVFWRPGYGYAAVPTAITGITSANPGVVTSPTHGLADGDLVRLTAVTGMTQVNYVVYTVANSTANTFELYTTDAVPIAVNTTGFTAYLSGGFAGKQKTTRSYEVIWDKSAGRWPQRTYYLPNLWRESVTTGTTTRTFTLQLYTEAGTIVDQGIFYSRLTFLAKGSTGFSQTVYDVAATRYPTASIYAQKTAALTTDIGGWSITFGTPTFHFRTLQLQEGANGQLASDYYWLVDVTVTTPAAAAILYELDCEVRELNRGIANP